jgi:hypothetical protein
MALSRRLVDSRTQWSMDCKDVPALEKRLETLHGYSVEESSSSLTKSCRHQRCQPIF